MPEPAVDPLAFYRAGSTEPWTVAVLAALVRAKRPYYVLETGTFEGLTTLHLFDAMNDYGAEHGAILYTIEQDPVRYAQAGQKFQAVERQHAGTAIELLQGDALAFMRNLAPASLDFIFLDDDHSAPHVKEELDEAARVLRPGGICCVHDVLGPFGLDVLVRMCGGIVLDLPRLHAAGGLGVLTK